VGSMAATPDGELARLQGVWFPALIMVDGQTTCDRRPVFPAGPDDPWLMTIRGDEFHVTANADYYATGGRLRLLPAEGRLTFCVLELPPDCDRPVGYRLDGDELLIQVGGATWSATFDREHTEATRYVRVAEEPAPAMTALMDTAEQSRWRWPGRG
jgi:hypothetical protein